MLPIKHQNGDKDCMMNTVLNYFEIHAPEQLERSLEVTPALWREKHYREGGTFESFEAYLRKQTERYSGEWAPSE
jgi:hypothetical protein